MILRPCICIVATLMVGACGPPDSESGAPTSRYQLVGTVVSADAEHNTVMIKHEAVADYMSAMTMPFNVPDGWVFDAAEPGARVRATLIVAETESWLEDVVITNSGARGAAAEVVVQAAEPGEPVPLIEVSKPAWRPVRTRCVSWALLRIHVHLHTLPVARFLSANVGELQVAVRYRRG